MAKQAAKSNTKTKAATKIPTLPFYIVIVLFVILYIALLKYTYLAIAFGAAAFLLIIVVIALEVMAGAKETGYMRSIIEIVVAIAIVVIFWFILRAALNTNYPIDVVPSCSMLQYLKRGDMVVLHGVAVASLKAPIVNVSATALQKASSNATQESFECIAYKINNGTLTASQFLSNGYSVGLLKQQGQQAQIVPYSSQNNNLIKYSCGVQNVIFNNGTTEQEAFTNSITIANTTINGDMNNSVVVYKTSQQDLFYQEGDSYVIHRVYAIINASGSYYFLTKGDNNPGLDIQYFNVPAAKNDIEGKVILVIPYLGYLKLIFSSFTGNGVENAGCNYHTVN